MGLQLWVARMQGMARPDGSPRDIDREFVLMYSITHEHKSFFALGNYLKFLPQLVDTMAKKRAVVDALAGDDSADYQDIYYSINGAPLCTARDAQLIFIALPLGGLLFCNLLPTGGAWGNMEVLLLWVFWQVLPLRITRT